jgi:hypothetical protein
LNFTLARFEEPRRGGITDFMNIKRQQELAAGHVRSSKALIADVRRERALLLEQVRQSQETIERSRALIARLDKLLAGLEGA